MLAQQIVFSLINSDGAWQQLLRNKYLGSKAFTQVKRKLGNSHFWSGLMNVSDELFSMGNFILQYGKQN
jgi:hypothetical protein